MLYASNESCYVPCSQRTSGNQHRAENYHAISWTIRRLIYFANFSLIIAWQFANFPHDDFINATFCLRNEIIITQLLRGVPRFKRQNFRNWQTIRRKGNLAIRCVTKQREASESSSQFIDFLCVLEVWTRNTLETRGLCIKIDENLITSRGKFRSPDENTSRTRNKR